MVIPSSIVVLLIYILFGWRHIPIYVNSQSWNMRMVLFFVSLSMISSEVLDGIVVFLLSKSRLLEF